MMKINEIFPDKVLADVVADTLDINTSESVTKEHLLSIICLSHSVKKGEENEKICNLEGLQHLKNLMHLCLQNNNIVDISPLSELRKLHELNLNCNKVFDISPLKDSIRLGYLYLRENSITDLSLISNFKWLRSLDISELNIKELPELSGLDNLKHLDIAHTQIKNLSPLKNLKLERLCLGDSCDLRTFPLLSELQVLQIGDNPLIRTAFTKKIFWSMALINENVMSETEKLNRFLKYDDSLNDYSFITNLPNLRTIRIARRTQNDN